MNGFETGGSLLAGFVIGYVVASLLESFLHQRIGHASRETVDRWQQGSRLLRYLAGIHYSHHVVHHLRTFKQDHVTQFRSREDRERVDRELARFGTAGDQIIRSGYGLRLDGLGGLVFALPLLPGLPWITSPDAAWAMLGAGVALALPPLLSHYIHPYLHLPHAEAVRQAPKLTGWLLGRWYFRTIARHHYVHHRCPRTNFNLLLGGDWLRRCHRTADGVQCSAMRQLGLPVDEAAAESALRG